MKKQQKPKNKWIPLVAILLLLPIFNISSQETKSSSSEVKTTVQQTVPKESASATVKEPVKDTVKETDKESTKDVAKVDSTTPEKPAAKDKKKEKFEFQSDRTSIELSEGKEYTLLSGSARIVSGSTIITADRIELYGKNFTFAKCKGNVSVKDGSKGIFLRCQDLFYDRDKKLSRIEGFAEMLDKKNNLVVKGNFLEDSGETEITIIEIGVRIIKEDIVCRSEFARYNRKTKMLELSGSPFVIKKGDEYRATKIIMNIETDEISLEGEVTGKIDQTKDEKKVETTDEKKVEETPGKTEEKKATETAPIDDKALPAIVPPIETETSAAKTSAAPSGTETAPLQIAPVVPVEKKVTGDKK